MDMYTLHDSSAWLLFYFIISYPGQSLIIQINVFFPHMARFIVLFNYKVLLLLYVVRGQPTLAMFFKRFNLMHVVNL